jgi:hypothetical protein
VVRFDYLDQGILCGGSWFPVLKMEWADATPLIPYVQQERFQPERLTALAREFSAMIADLAGAGLAHGDLQHGNLLVTPSGGLKLVDYDGMFVPSLAGAGSTERGHQNYQSPLRQNDWGPELDNFSAWIIYLSLIALTFDPFLWDSIPGAGDEALLFHKEDFVRPQSSQALASIRSSAIEELRILGEYVYKLCSLRLQEIPRLDPSQVPEPSDATSTSPAEVPSIGTSKPDWMVSAELTAQPSGSGWISDHLPPPQRLRFTGSRRPIAYLELTTLAALASVGVLALLAVLSIESALGVAGAVLGAFIAASWLLVRATPEWRIKSARQRVLTDRRAAVERARAVVGALEAQRRALGERERAASEATTQRLEAAKLAEKKERESIDGQVSAKIAGIAQRRQDAQSKEATERATALRKEQDEHFRRELSRHAIATASFPGIGPALLSNLSRANIRTAADFTGVTISRSHYHRYTNEVASFRLAGGRLVHVEGIGPKKAQPLAAWRSRLEAAARASMPSTLSGATEHAIRSKYANELQLLTSEEQSARAASAQQHAEARRRHEAAQTVIAAELQRVHQDGARDRAKLETQLAQARQVVEGAELPRAIADRELAACEEISYVRYLARGLRS